MSAFYFVEPTDSLFVRGNLAFGDPGEFGPGVMPPPPSLFAGAFRSAILARDPQALARYVATGKANDGELDAVVGRLHPDTGDIVQRGSFRLSWISLARRSFDRDGATVEPVFPLAADLVKLEAGLARLTPEPASPLVSDGSELPAVAVLRTSKQSKPEGGFYLTAPGWQRHLAGELPDLGSHCIPAASLYTRDPRLGIGLDSAAGTVQTGLIYTTEGYAFNPADSRGTASTGFLVGIEGAGDRLGETGFLRLGGDGRGARYQRVGYQPSPPLTETIARNRRCRLVLATPGLFAGGWLPTGVHQQGAHYILQAADCTARLVCAATPRREVISGWDLFRWQPKDAERVAPAGSVYWFDELSGPIDKLAAWVATGLWDDNAPAQRRSEGYNLAWLGAWT